MQCVKAPFSGPMDARIAIDWNMVTYFLHYESPEERRIVEVIGSDVTTELTCVSTNPLRSTRNGWRNPWILRSVWLPLAKKRNWMKRTTGTVASARYWLVSRLL